MTDLKDGHKQTAISSMSTEGAGQRGVSDALLVALHLVTAQLRTPPHPPLPPTSPRSYIGVQENEVLISA